MADVPPARRLGCVDAARMLLEKGFDSTSAAYETVEQEVLQSWVAAGKRWDARYDPAGEPDPEDPHSPAPKPLLPFFEEVIWPSLQKRFAGTHEPDLEVYRHYGMHTGADGKPESHGRPSQVVRKLLQVRKSIGLAGKKDTDEQFYGLVMRRMPTVLWQELARKQEQHLVDGVLDVDGLALIHI